MRTMSINICLAILVLAGCPGIHAEATELSAEAKSGMTREVARGGSEVLLCAMGKNSDQAILDCLNSALDANIRNETDSLPFLVGAYFAAWARLTGSEQNAGVKEKWLSLTLGRYSEMWKETGLTDREISEAAGIGYSGVQGELERMRQ